jgi:hypothetical protein
MKTNSLPVFAAFAASCLTCPPASAPAADKNTSTPGGASVAQQMRSSCWQRRKAGG